MKCLCRVRCEVKRCGLSLNGNLGDNICILRGGQMFNGINESTKSCLSEPTQ